MSEKIMGGVENDFVSEASLPAKVGFWPKVKAFLFQEIKVELTPAQQKFEDDLNDFLHLEITWQDFKDFLFQEVTFGKKKNK
ncbi:MAG: hypothetical protein J6A04_06590 [Clostridia bacterium]|nr:hypothetical protein [Clostridia bacterium]